MTKVLKSSTNVSLNNNLSKLNNLSNIKLEEDDLVVIRKKPGFQEKEFITVEGLVKHPGTYTIKSNDYTFFDLYPDCGGFLDDASMDGVKIIRKNVISQNLVTDNIDTKPAENIRPFIEFGVDVENILKLSEKYKLH